ncbi:MAG: lamin tail domain-containing protein, partial [Clostridia bacterium]|nr:lamin tail domain-containing protein [Clostridia bacterium]
MKPRRPAWLPLLFCIAAVVLIILVSPKEPVTRAYHTTATEDGVVDRAVGGKDPYYEGLVISELMSSNTSAVPDETGVYHDWLEIWNSSDHDIDLTDVGLSDRTDSIRFLFPAMILPADGRVIVFCSDTNAAVAGEALHAKFKLSSVGETVSLFDPSAYLLDSVATPIMGSNESWALIDGTFTATTDYSPGYPNGREGYDAYQKSTMVMAGDLIINEIMPDPLTGLRDGDDELVDWIELYNTTDKPIDLSNYALSDKEDKALAWRFPAGATVAPYGYYVVYCSGKDVGVDPNGVPHASFRLSAEHDVVVLSDSHGRLVDRVIIDNIPEDCSYGRNGDGSFSIYHLATPGLPNTETGAHQMDYNLRMMNPTGVYITEVMASNDSTLVYQGAKFCDWVELYNSSSVTVDLSGYGLSDNIGRARKWQFPAGTTIAPGEHKVILCDGKTDLSTTAQLHTSFRILRPGSEVMCLSDPTGRILDKIVLPLIPTDVSYGRTAGLAGFFYYDAPTPMAANGFGFNGYAEAPQLLVEPGLHYDTVYTGFSIPAGTTVYYTTDGSEPTEQSTLYQGETIELNFTTVLRARAFAFNGDQPSDITTGTYFINAYHSLPIVSLTLDPDDLWNEEYGIYAAGPNVDKSVFPFKNTVYRKVKESDLPDKVGHV